MLKPYCFCEDDEEVLSYLGKDILQSRFVFDNNSLHNGMLAHCLDGLVFLHYICLIVHLILLVALKKQLQLALSQLTLSKSNV